MARKYRQKKPKLVNRFRNKNTEVVVGEEAEVPTIPQYEMGDVNRDGVVNVVDIVHLVGVILGNN